ncbi:MAG TPA: formimidoylglutamate deiminase [Bryobacteraceae bacterium]|nr:formimidoylglutamate deiminase [Bryobacteraceae bacterium]
MDRETGWLPDLTWLDGAFESGVTLFADDEGRIARLSHDARNAARLSGRAMLPGLVNVHSHTFQRATRGRTERRSADRDTFWTWRESMYRAANRVSLESIYHIARMAFMEMALSGITTVGEFHYLHHDSRGVPYTERNATALAIARAAREVGVRLVILHAAYVRAGFGKPADPEQARFITPRVEDFIADTEALRQSVPVGVAPHSVRAVPLDALREIAAYAKSNGLPLHMHVAEQPAEVEASIAEYGLRPVELLHDEGIIDENFTAVHAIHITDEEARWLGGATVCACPTSERNLGDGAVPADKLYAAGARIAFGSDSNIQIDLVEDARLLEYHLRMNRLERAVLPGSGRTLFESATRSGARSLMAPSGWFEPRRAADFFTVDLNDPSIAGADAATLIDNVMFSLERTAIRDVVVNGKRIVCDGRHPLQEEITREFVKVQKELW